MSKISPPLLTSAQLRAARGWLGISQKALAAEVRLSSRTLLRIEAGEIPAQGETLARIGALLESRGIEFLFENGEGVGVRIKASSARDGARGSVASVRGTARHDV